jgi:hypothetical protein
VILTGLLASQAFLLAQCSCIPKEYESFFGLHAEQQYGEFQTYALEKQFEIFEYDLKCRHPNDFGLSQIIAMRGEEAIPFLKERIEEAKSDRQQVAIISIFTHMSIMRYAELRDDPELMALLEEVIASMHPSYRKRGERAWWVIKEEPDWEDDIAARGEGAIPFLMERLEQAQSDWHRVQIIRLFLYMSEKGYGDFRDDPQVIASLEEVVAALEDYPTNYRSMGEEELMRIKERNDE